MDFDFISFALGAVSGVIGAAAVGRAKFAQLQDRLRVAEDRLTAAVNKNINRR